MDRSNNLAEKSHDRVQSHVKLCLRHEFKNPLPKDASMHEIAPNANKLKEKIRALLLQAKRESLKVKRL